MGKTLRSRLYSASAIATKVAEIGGKKIKDNSITPIFNNSSGRHSLGIAAALAVQKIIH